MMVEWGTGQRGIKGRKKWDNYNNIINKIYFKNSGYCTILIYSDKIDFYKKIYMHY